MTPCPTTRASPSTTSPPIPEWKTPKVHYGLGDDWDQPEADMTLDAQGYYTATIDTKGKKIDFVFHDADTDGWENPEGGGNYHANVGITHVGVSRAEPQPSAIPNPSAPRPVSSCTTSPPALRTTAACTCGAPM